jgi:hypothetical protein
MSDPVDVAGLRALLEEATDRPWEVVERWVLHRLPGGGSQSIVRGLDSDPDLDLIVALVNAAPALLDRLAAVERERDQYKVWWESALTLRAAAMAERDTAQAERDAAVEKCRQWALRAQEAIDEVTRLHAALTDAGTVERVAQAIRDSFDRYVTSIEEDRRVTEVPVPWMFAAARAALDAIARAGGA